jgi:hypothetical protein
LHIKSTFQEYYTNIIIPNKHRIQSLYLSNPFIVDLFFSPVRIASKLIRLDTLIFYNIKSKYLPNILNYLVSLSNLPSLVIIPLDLIHKSNNLCGQIFRLPALIYCKLSLERDAESEPLSMATDEISPIKHLVVTKAVHLNELPALLSYVPQLRRLQLHSLDGSRKKQTNSQSMMLNYLTHVSLDMKSVTFDQLESIMIKLFPQLEMLHISTQYNEAYLNANRWEKLILSYLPHLRTFTFQYINYIQNSDNHLVYKNIIHQFSSLFWSERKWFFAYHFYRAQYRDHVIFYSTNPYR